jgi:hypothetical protein
MKRILNKLTLPLYAALFLMDRVVLLFIWIETAHKFKRWIRSEELMLYSVIRVMIFLTVIMFLSIFVLSDFN